eukprot:NODE_12235_length_1237_cov_5.157658.p1 GENE.NODE_12235_length_1237_cov_5.157658~~NODE_12235_length_1237_cov_5.157658.p1  ORF type:complete len:349 (-),score=81.71 NODE_12235_length_1237_cov_5.157658:108-1154(-)
MPVPLSLLGAEGEFLVGKVALITGGSSGVGFETAIGLARRGCTVVITSRSQKRGEAAVEKIRHQAAGGPAALAVAMLLECTGPLQGFRDFASEYKSKYARLDILIHNAGGFPPLRTKQQADGLELCFAERMASVHALTYFLWDLLTKSGTPESPSRVIVTTGAGVTYGKQDSQQWVDFARNEAGGELEGKMFGGTLAVMPGLIGWAKFLGKACDDAKVPVLFLITHPGMASGTEFGGFWFKCVTKTICCPCFQMLLCCMGSHSAESGSLPNIAAVVLPARAAIPQGALVGPMQTSKGPPGIVDLDDLNGPDAKKWKVVAGPQSIELGEIAYAELAKKTKMNLEVVGGK